MFDLDSLFPQAISAFADCCQAAIAFFWIFKGRCDPLIAVLRFSKMPVRSFDFCAANFQEAGAINQLLCHNFSGGRCDPRLLRRNITTGWCNPPLSHRYLWISHCNPPDFHATIFQEASAIPNCRSAMYLPASLIPRLPRRDLSSSRYNPLIAAPQFFFWSTQSPNCHAPIYLLAGNIPWLLCHNFLDSEDGIWLLILRTTPRLEFKEGPISIVHINKQDLLMTEDCPEFNANILHAYAGSNWATCPKTRQSFGGTCLQLAGETLHTNVSFNLTLLGHPLKRNSWLCMILAKWFYMYAVSYGTLASHRKLQWWCTKTMTPAGLWEMHRNLPLARDTWILSIFCCAIELRWI
jgi:hypothetical protein